jgi:hypothetical protein
MSAYLKKSRRKQQNNEYDKKKEVHWIKRRRKN